MLAAFDLSLTGTGWAVGPRDALPRSGVWELPKGRENLPRALTMLRQSIMSILRLEKVTVVFIEAPMHVIDEEHSAEAAYVLICLSAVAQEVSNACACRVRLSSSSTWRKSIFGTSWPKNPKDAALGRVARMGLSVQTHDAAEAVLLWVHGMLVTDRNWQPPKGALGPCLL